MFSYAGERTDNADLYASVRDPSIDGWLTKHQAAGFFHSLYCTLAQNSYLLIFPFISVCLVVAW